MFRIDNRLIDTNNQPYIIAELSANHNGSLERAKQSIKAAKDAGAHAVKIQSYTADTMTIDCDKSDFIIKGGLWNNYKLYQLYEEAHTPFAWHGEIFRYAREIGITVFSTPFDETAVDLLEQFDVPAYKIASFELTDLPLISYVAKKGKPMLMSTGMATQDEISEAVETARIGGCNSLLLFHCISSYPAPIEQANLRQMCDIQKTFKVSVGLSDHTMGNVAAVTSVALGACAIEKHFTLSRSVKGPDSEFSMEPAELADLVRDTKDAWLACGHASFERPQAESQNRMFRRSVYFVADIKAGETISSFHIRRIRPGFGLPPKFFDSLIGRTVRTDVSRGDPVTWDVLQTD